MTPPLVFALPGNEAGAAALCERLPGEAGDIETRRFPDAETYLRVRSDVAGRQTILVCTLRGPDAKFLPLVYAAATLRELGAAGVGLVAPYLAYMRQDRRFNEGEAVTSAVFARALSPWIDWLVTVDPHLHRHHALSEIYSVPGRVVHAGPLIAAWIGAHVADPVLIGPDSESEQWVADVATRAGAPFTILEKTRRGDRDVSVSLPDPDVVRGRTPVLVDDIVSTARTMIETIGHLTALGLPPPVCIGVHGVFAGDAYDALAKAGAAEIVTTNAIPGPSARIDVYGAIADDLRESGLAAG
jgi:ribose-phosphate pyrophosphokinase